MIPNKYIDEKKWGKESKKIANEFDSFYSWK